MKFTLLSILVFSNCLRSCTAIANTEIENQTNALSTTIQNIFVDKEVQIYDYNDQLKSVIVDSKEVFFSLHDGRYIFGGFVYDTERQIDIVEEQKSKQRLIILNNQPKSLFVSYPSTIEAKHEVTVFTDIDCPYCRKLHNSISDLNNLGVSVNYVMLPRAGMTSASYAKTLAALCSSNPSETVTLAMQNQNTPLNPCDTSKLNQHISLADTLKINATPTILLPNGQLQLGAVSPQQLMKILNEAK